jgi:anaerobic magnesium-protoporphyrin IX monomethyl ester cyclase
MLIDDYKITAFDIWDDTFTLDKKWLGEICNGMRKEGMDIQWYCRGRVNNIDRETVLTMKNAGCKAILLGVESGSQRVLNVIRKAITVEQAKQSVKTCVDNGISVKAGFMVNHPTETLNDVRKTIELIRYFHDISDGKSSKIKIIPGPTRIYPGTHVEYLAKKNNKLPADFNWAKPYYNPRYKLWDSSPSLPLYEEIPLEKLMEFYIRESLKLGDWFTPSMLTFFNLKAVLNNPQLSNMKLLGKNAMTILTRFRPAHYKNSINEYVGYLRHRNQDASSSSESL